MKALLIPPGTEKCQWVDLRDDDQVPHLVELLGGPVMVLSFVPDSICPIIRKDGVDLPPNTRGTAVLSGVLEPNDLLGGPLVLTGFDPETEEAEDLPEWFSMNLPEGWLPREEA